MMVVNTNVKDNVIQYTYIAEIARPVFGRLLSEAEVDTDLEVFLAHDLRRAFFVHFLRLTEDEEWERGRAIAGDE